MSPQPAQQGGCLDWTCPRRQRLRLLGTDHRGLRATGISLPRTAQTQYDAGPLVPAGQPLLPGNLVFYGTPSNVHHVGLYIGGGKIVQAPNVGQLIKIGPYRWSGDDYLAASRPSK